MIEISGQPLTLEEIAQIAGGTVRVELSAAAAGQIEASRQVVQRAIAHRSPVYGINTGFGKLCEVRIADDAVERLQLNLVRSHACGVGRLLSEEETRVIMALRARPWGRAPRLAGLADPGGAMSLEALLGTPAAFDQRIHAVRPHPGQAASAARLRSLLEGSDVDPARRKTPARVQDAYSLRCMPQVHGAVRGALAYARAAVEIETGSATDNPLVFPETGDVLSGGNFHGAPLAMAFDTAAIGLTTLGSITERRIDRLVNPDLNPGLP